MAEVTVAQPQAKDWQYTDRVPDDLDVFDGALELAFGWYETTANFTAIPRHACVCFKDDLTLVATTGPAEDRESQRYAELFAASPKLLTALEHAVSIIEQLIPEPSARGVADVVLYEARAAIAKARGA